MDSILYELWDVIDGQNDSLLKTVRVASAPTMDAADQRAIVAVKAHVKFMGYTRRGLVLFRGSSIVWEVA